MVFSCLDMPGQASGDVVEHEQDYDTLDDIDSYKDVYRLKVGW